MLILFKLNKNYLIHARFAIETIRAGFIGTILTGTARTRRARLHALEHIAHVDRLGPEHTIGQPDMLDPTEQIEYGRHLCVELVHEIARRLLGQRARVLLDLGIAQRASHRQEDVLGVQVRVGLAALGTLELRPRRRLILVRLDLNAYAIELVLDHVH